MLPLMTPEEREAWTTLGTGPELCGWLRSFWDERALRSAMYRPVRMASHYQRLAEARRSFYLKNPRSLSGMSDSFGRAEGLAIDDRGLLLIRLGRPDHDQPCPEEYAVDSPPNLVGRCWVYWRPEGYWIFYLSTRDRFGEDWPYGDYRVQEDLSQQAEPGTVFFQQYVMNADISEETKRRFVRLGPVFRNRKLALAGAATGIRTDPNDEFDLNGGLDGAEALALQQEVRDATRRHTAEVLEQIPDVPNVASAVSVRYEALRFLDPGSGTWQIWLLTSLRAGDLTRSSSREDPTLDASGRFATLAGGELTVGQIAQLSVPASVPEFAGILLKAALTARPGSLPVTVAIEDLNAPGTGAWIQDTINVPSIGGLPQLSDIAVAQGEGGTWTRDGETFLRLSPAHITNTDGSIDTYFEVYGLRPGSLYDVELRLAPVDVADRIWRLEPDDLGFRLQFTTEMPGDIGRHHLRLDLSGTEPGEYTLAVRIQDEQSKAYSLPAVTDIFVAER
ncbi:MAG: hypothetical protein ACR2GQ_07860 [Gemmatimonadota bacterium]